MKNHIPLIALSLALSVGCSDSLGLVEKSCTEIGCLTFVRVELRFLSGLTPDDVQIVVEHTGQSFTCEPGTETDPCHRGFQPDFDPSGPTDNVLILLNEAPKELRITVTSPDGSESQIVTPTYQRSQPNGPDCEPTCLSASETARFDL